MRKICIHLEDDFCSQAQGFIHTRDQGFSETFIILSMQHAHGIAMLAGQLVRQAARTIG